MCGNTQTAANGNYKLSNVADDLVTLDVSKSTSPAVVDGKQTLCAFCSISLHETYFNSKVCKRCFALLYMAGVPEKEIHEKSLKTNFSQQQKRP